MKKQSLLAAGIDFVDQTVKLIESLPQSGWKAVVGPQLEICVKSMLDNMRIAMEGKSANIRKRHVSLSKELAQECGFWLKLLGTVFPENTVVARLRMDCREIEKCIVSWEFCKSS